MEVLREYIKDTCGVTLRPPELSYLDGRVIETLGVTAKEYIDEFKDSDGQCDIETIFFNDLLEDIRQQGINSLRVELINYLYDADPDFEKYL